MKKFLFFAIGTLVALSFAVERPVAQMGWDLASIYARYTDIADSAFVKQSATEYVDSTKAKNGSISGADLTTTLIGLLRWQVNSNPADDNFSGMEILGVAGEALTIGTLVHIHTDSTWTKADADSAITMPAVGIALESINAAATGRIGLFGILRDDGNFAWDDGVLLYASATTGVITDTKPAGAGDQVQIIGIALEDDKVLFNPSYVLVEVAE